MESKSTPREHLRDIGEYLRDLLSTTTRLSLNMIYKTIIKSK